MNKSSRFGLSGGVLKIIALVTMIVDHTAAVLLVYSSNPQWYLLGRIIGRLAFPIYCFLLVQGFCYTKNVKKYMVRLFFFALISEVPYDLAFRGVVLELSNQNVFFTLFLGLLALVLIQYVQNMGMRKGNNSHIISRFVGFIGILMVFAMAYFFRGDYGVDGVTFIILFYLCRTSKLEIALVNIIMNLAMGLGGGVQVYGMLSALPIALYNGKKGPSLKYFFYAIYPVHLMILYLIANYFL